MILFAFNILVFLPAVKGDFVFDDIHLVRNSPIIQNPGFLRSFLGQAFGDPLGQDANNPEMAKSVRYYRPLTAFAFWLDYKLWGFNAAGYHLTNILIHSFNVILLFLLLARLFNNLPAAFASASLFSVFPTHFENVAWISGRTDLLALFMLLVSAHFFLSFIRKGIPRDSLSAAFFFFLALLSKETVILSLLIYVYLVCFYGKKENKASRISFILTFSSAWIAFLVLRSNAVGLPAMNFSILPLGTFFSGLGFYLSRAVFPFFLGFSIPDEKIFNSTFYFFAGIIFCLFWIAAGGYFLFKKKALPVFLLWAGIAFIWLIPSLLLFFFENQVSLLAWRFLYMPVAAAVSLGVTFLSRHLRPLLFGLLVSFLALFYAFELLPHVRHYGKSEREFWLELQHLERENRVFRLNHATVLLSVNEARADVLLESLIRDESSFQADFFQRRALETAAFHYTSVNQLQKARVYFTTLFSRAQEQPLSVYFQFAVFLAKSGDRQKGQAVVEHYMKLFPENHEVLLHAADFFLLTGDPVQALQVLQKDFRLFPTSSVLEKIKKLQASQRHE